MTDYVTPTTWEQCAAHVEAGGVVEIEDAPGVWINDRAATTIYRGRCGTPDDGWAPRRLVPIESAAAPAAGDDLRERIARAIYADDVENERTDFREGVAPCYYDNADAVLAVLPPQPAPSPVPSRPDGVLRDAANRLRWIANSGYIEDPGIKRIIRSWADELDATPAPPWPGAVLSGCVDEDGVPTWLAQAGQVRGEQVRRRSDLVWVNNDQMVAFPDTVWVEVRAPRAVPAPETERVPWWAAVGRWTTGDELIVEVARTSVVPVVTVEGGGRVRVAPDGTVEVLARDGAKS